MNILRFLVRSLITLTLLAAALGAVASAVLLAPPVQGWLLRRELAKLPAVRVSFDSCWARFGRMEIERVRVERGGHVLTAPKVSAELPVLQSVWRRELRLQRLTAKGWTLELAASGGANGGTPAGGGPAVAAPLATVPATSGTAAGPEHAVPGSLRWVAEALHRGFVDTRLPVDFATERVELAGTVVRRDATGTTTRRMEVSLQGGPLAAGRDSALAVAAETMRVDAENRPVEVTLRGTLAVRMDTPRTVSRLAWTGTVVPKGGPLQTAPELAVEAAAARGEGGRETYAVTLARDGRTLATVHGGYTVATRGFAAEATLALTAEDFALLAQAETWPVTALNGQGRLEIDAGNGDLSVEGRLVGRTGRLAGLSPLLARMAPEGPLVAQVAARRRGTRWDVERLELTVAGARPIATVELRQRFTYEAGDRKLTVAEPAKEWLKVKLEALPLAWLPDPTAGWQFTAGELAGEVGVAPTPDGGFALRPVGRLTARGVAVAQGGRVVADGLDVSLGLEASHSPAGWTCRYAPLVVASGGRELLVLEGTGSGGAGPGRPAVWTGTLKAQLDAWAGRLERWGGAAAKTTARKLEGTFTLSVGPTLTTEATLTLGGAREQDRVKATVKVSGATDQRLSFEVPVVANWSGRTSDFTAEGTWAPSSYGATTVLKLHGKELDLALLRPMAALVQPRGGAAVAAANANAGRANGGDGGRAALVRPFWGDAYGSVALALERLRVGADEFRGVEATAYVEERTIKVTYGRHVLGKDVEGRVTGEVTFDPAATPTYRMAFTLGPDEVDAATVFGTEDERRRPAFEGKFKLERTLVSTGASLAELVAQARQDIRLTSKSGIVRFLRAGTLEMEPEKATPVADAMGSVGSAVGWLFGVDRRTRTNLALTKPDAQTQAVLDFTYPLAELGYSDLSLAATWGRDGVVRVTDLALNAGKVRLTGVGRLEERRGESMRRWPLSLDLKLGTNGKLAELMTKTGLPVNAADGMGYTWLAVPVHFGGTLEQMDVGHWQRMLAQAATPKPMPAENAADAAKPGAKKQP
ncbi:hypothetical protein [Opitutus sp. ER46]|uniref:hypothetical protein n=1 Tax=Opitutus sp. ER46 TaxID=2161864 RepID=UPI000D2F4974|nr:hypothetical protein [Opitutus sp. ER46]PTX96500.1 hypothetical protein DB354_07535 [Opitutus sp. ER46]